MSSCLPAFVSQVSGISQETHFLIQSSISSNNLPSNHITAKLAERLKSILGHVKEILPTMSSSGLDAEEQQFQDEVAAIKQWWSEPRWRFTKRPFTAEQIANKRGNLTIQHPGNVLSKKLWDIVEKRYAVSLPP
jgi:hypothetical protein